MNLNKTGNEPMLLNINCKGELSNSYQSGLHGKSWNLKNQTPQKYWRKYNKFKK